MVKQWLLIALFLTVNYKGVAQTETLTLTNVLDIVKKYHPVALQANLKVDSAEANRLAARGAFDPAVSVSNEQKRFAGTSYYYHTNAELKIPTWYGVDVKGGIEDNGGSRLFSELTSGRSSYIGVGIPLLKGLVLDKRRATLQQAKIIVEQAEAERRNAYNDLLYNAASAYWEWVRAWRVYEVLTQVVSNNQRRYNFVLSSFLGGDKAAIDTTEALVQLQNFMLQQSDAYYNWLSAGLDLSNYLWLENQVPFNLDPSILPDTSWQKVNITGYEVPLIDSVLNAALTTHPKLRSLAVKGDVLNIERRFKTQSLLPSLKVNYNFLRKGYEPWKGIGQNFLDNNYKYGFELSVPLFLREARGDLAVANVKLKSNQLQQDQTTLEIGNKVKTYFNQLLTLRRQVVLVEQALSNYNRLLRAEEIKFEIGESSLFLLNSRENKVLDAEQKLAELKTKFFKAQVALQWSAGLLF